jgi:GNAT superfamily N-acetyltransferase
VKEKERLTFRSSYWEDLSARDEFKKFLNSTFGLDLTLWEQKGFWDDDLYTPFSFFEGNRIVSSVCLYSMDMVIEGRQRRVGQFSGVGTLPQFRRRGLNRRLTEQAMQWASSTHDGFFLFATDEAVPFYAKCGFVPVQESAATLMIESPKPRKGLQKLDTQTDKDLERIYRLACERAPVSDVLGVLNPKLLMFHCLYTLQDHAYYVPDLDVVVFFKVDRERLILFDVVGRHVPSFSELHPYLAQQPHSEVWFEFMPDKMGVEATGWRTPEGNNTHIHLPFRLPQQNCIIPYVAHA